MTSPSRQLRLGQRFGVAAWRGMMGAGAFMTGLRKLSPPGAFSHHAYGAEEAERLELIDPASRTPDRTPVVYIHGGGWICGKKEIYTGDLFFLAEAGHPVFNLEYPLAPETPHPGMLLSLLSSLAWIREYYPQHESVHLMGDSAGGNLALMLGILCENPELAKNLRSEPLAAMPKIESVVSIYGVLDRLTWIERKFPSAALMLECYAGKSALEPEVGPELAVTPMDLSFEALPPTFIGVGTKDQLYESSRICSQHLQASFEDIQYEEYPGEGHGFFNRSGRPASQKLRADILGFLARH
jgi:acetyl esterase/lipase